MLRFNLVDGTKVVPRGLRGKGVDPGNFADAEKRSVFAG